MCDFAVLSRHDFGYFKVVYFIAIKPGRKYTYVAISVTFNSQIYKKKNVTILSKWNKEKS